MARDGLAARVTMTNAALAVVAAAMLLAMEAATGRIPIKEGLGYDGTDYATMLDDLHHGAMNTKLRPAIVVANRPAYQIMGDAVDAFRLMNYLYAGLLAWLVCVLFDRYAAVSSRVPWTSRVVKALLIVNLFAAIAVAKSAAFYPVLVDLGAMALVLAAIVLCLYGPRWATAAATVAAVLAREFALGVVLFGVARDLRTRRSLWTIGVTWLPALVAWAGWRLIVVSSGDGSMPLGLADFAANLTSRRDWLFVPLFTYFMLTVFGGISLFVFARARPARALLLREPEWAVYAVSLLAAAGIGELDLWRYLAYLLPVFVVLFAEASRELAAAPRRLAVVGAIVCVATLVTQRPFQRMDMTAYFVDWFPYYVHRGLVPLDLGHMPSLWPVWAWRFLAAGGLLLMMVAIPPLFARATAPDTKARR